MLVLVLVLVLLLLLLLACGLGGGRRALLRKELRVPSNARLRSGGYLGRHDGRFR